MEQHDEPNVSHYEKAQLLVRDVCHYFLAEPNCKVFPPPLNSPDLLLTEHLWDLIRCIVQDRNAHDIKHLIAILLEEWKNFPQGVIKQHIHSMRNRIRLVINAEGGKTL